MRGLVSAGAALVVAGLLFASARGVVTAPTAPRDGNSVVATGPEPGTYLEDRVEVSWSTEAPIPVSRFFHVTRDDELIYMAASTESLFEDWSAVPGEQYEYCVYEIEAGVLEPDYGTLEEVGCDFGGRRIAPPTGFQASDGLHETHVRLKWSDRSGIEDGYNLYRDAGNALRFDGDNDFVAAEGLVDLAGSFTFEFWAKRASTTTEDFVVNLEVNPNGDPVDVDMEIGFLANSRFAVAFGTDVLAIPITPDTEWHHWAVAYDAPNRRRIVYLDGEEIGRQDDGAVNSPTGDLEFGRRSKQGPAKNRGHFDGLLDEIRFWTVALTESQVAARRSALLTGSEPGLAGYWPMDVLQGGVAPDFFGGHPGVLVDFNGQYWVDSSIPDFRAEIGPDLTAYSDVTAVAGFRQYRYRVAAYEDADGNGVYSKAEDYESAIGDPQDDTGWRALLTPPGDVSATDGQYLDRVVITWADVSEVEEGYRVYRGPKNGPLEPGALLGSVGPGETTFTDPDGHFGDNYPYCVTAFGGGAESIPMCDLGRRGGLSAPDSVTATALTWDDRIVVTWPDDNETEDGFEVFRFGAGDPVPSPFPGDAIPYATLDANAEEYNDLGAAPGAQYDYCVRAFSQADPLNISYSEHTCTDAPGIRAVILPPFELTATQDDFEDRVELAWKNRSTSVMVFWVYRNDELIQILDFNTKKTTDRGIPSDEDIRYCVSGATVVTPNARALQGQVAQVLEAMDVEDAVREKTGGVASSLQERLAAVEEIVMTEVASKGGSVVGFEESARDCADGRRSLLAPTAVEATDNEHESHVQLTWEDNSQAEKGYFIYRSAPGVPVDPAADRIATLSANRTSFGDYEGEPGVKFVYTVEAFDDDDSSLPDQDEGLRTLEPPTQFTASDGTSETEVRLKWRDNSTAEEGYRIYRRVAGDPVFEVIHETGSNEPAFTDTPPDALRGAALQYRVVAFDAAGESTAAGDEGSTYIMAPSNVNASESYTEPPIVVVWVDGSNVEDGYRVTRRQRGSTNVERTVDLDPNTTQFVDDDTNLQDGVQYVYCVSASLGSNGSTLYSDAGCDVGYVFLPPTGSTGGGTGPDRTARRIAGPYGFSADTRARFGYSVSMDGPTAVVGAPGANVPPDRGAAGVFGVNSNNIWTLAQNLVPASGRDFGFAVDVDGSYLVGGDPNSADGGRFAVWKFGTSWTKVSEVSVGGGGGYSVAAAGRYVAVGAPAYTAAGYPPGHGGALVCDVDSDPACATAVRLETLLPVKLDQSAQFGFAVDITRRSWSWIDDQSVEQFEDQLYTLVGAPGDSTQQAFMFECDLNRERPEGDTTPACTLPDDWALVQEMSSPFQSPASTLFGAAVAIEGNVALIGAPAANGVVPRTRNDESGAWDELPFRRELSAGFFGMSIALKGTTVLVGAPYSKVDQVPSAGQVFVYSWSEQGLTEKLVTYDARAAGKPVENGGFGISVALGPDLYVVGASEDDRGAVYAIPFGFVPPDDPVPPPEVTLAEPTDVTASDGAAPDRIQIRWNDEAEEESGHYVYRSKIGGSYERLTEVAPDTEFYDDFNAAPGEAYTYCVSAFSASGGEILETEKVCDIGWRPPNGTIAGFVATSGGAGTEDTEVCIMPSPNKALLFDGVGGFVSAPVGEEMFRGNDFTIETWIRPHRVTGEQYLFALENAYTIALVDGDLRFEAEESDGPISLTADVSLEAGSWHHIAVVRGGSGDFLNDLLFFVDGVRVKRHERDNALVVGEEPDTLYVGQLGDGTGWFNGEIDDLRFWNRERSRDEIAEGRFGVLRGNEENLVANWPMDDGRRLIAPEISEFAFHGQLSGGVYLADDGAPIRTCDVTAADGNFSIQRIRYGESTEFELRPTLAGREFQPSFQLVTLTTESPAQNQIIFVDATAYSVSGVVQYQDVVDGEVFECPIADIGVHLAKEPVALDNNLKTATKADGTYALSVEPSADETDTWFVIPRFAGDAGGALAHTFDPPYAELTVLGDLFDVTFNDELRHELSGYVTGGDPETCGKDIGTVTLRIFTEDSCYDRYVTIHTGADPDQGSVPEEDEFYGGAYAVDLPPLNYLVEVVDVVNAPPDRAEDIRAFFQSLGAVEVDLTEGDVERNLIYRAPLEIAIAGLEGGSCTIEQKDEDGNVLRVLPSVAVIGEYGFEELTISVHERYAPGALGTCPVTDGTVTIYDAISDRVDQDSTVALDGNGEVKYTVFGASPNIYSGARIGGVDRSFQKPITAVAMVEGRAPLMTTEWAIVEGYRERSSTFVSATTEQFPLLIVHDPPGSNSSAFIEEGSTFCNSISSTWTLGGSAGLDFTGRFGFKTEFVTAPVGAGVTIQTGGGFEIGAHLNAGADYTFLQPGMPNREICVTTTEAITTSSDMTWVGEDIHVGVALNLIFAIADVLKVDDKTCALNLSETLAADLNEADPFETTYAYGKSHIALSLIPELENLIRLAGSDASITGEIKGQETTIRLRDALANWYRQLSNSRALQQEALQNPDINRSFSGGTEFTYTESVDTTRVTSFESLRIYVEAGGRAGGVFDIGKMETSILGTFEVHSEWVNESQSTATASKTIGYTLSDGDTGDYFSVDVAKNPRYGTFVFGTRSGRSSNPWEANTQKRDNPIILVDPPVLYNVDPDDAGRFQLTLINGSESNERRPYMLSVPGAANPFNLTLSVAGDLLSETPYLLEPGRALTVNMDVYASPSAFAYRRVGVMMYPETEMEIWKADPRQPFALSDTAFFSVFFDSTGGNVLARVIEPGWNWISTNRPEGEVSTLLKEYPARHGDLIRGRTAEARFDSVQGWIGDLRRLKPGEAYHARIQKAGLLRIKGDAVEPGTDLPLRKGWNWIGYLPTKPMPIADALVSLGQRIVEGDAVVGQDGFAQYTNRGGWVGTLEDMVPGEAYQIFLSGGGTLTYPEAPEQAAARPPTVVETVAGGPEWKLVPTDFDASMIMVAEIRQEDRPMDHGAFRVAVASGDEIRGVGDVRWVESLEQYVAFVQIFGSPENEEDLQVHVYDGETDLVYENVGTVHYAAQTMLGQAAAPVALDLANAGLGTELLEVPEEFALYPNYPNPFNPVTVIGYDLPQSGKVELAVYDILGRRVAMLVNQEQNAGRYRVLFDARSLASGVYLYRMHVGSFTQVGKMILVK